MLSLSFSLYDVRSILNFLYCFISSTTKNKVLFYGNPSQVAFFLYKMSCLDELCIIVGTSGIQCIVVVSGVMVIDGLYSAMVTLGYSILYVV